ncbi:MAG: hypothetical protein JSU85_05985 [Candidatus Zixiibacteriota bacterium]|nr:MAG: hypothetical protein JSU85_05985 [candidate division Zixibacteria bacterium]
MSEADPTAAELLTAVNAAILALVSGTVLSQTIGNRTYTKNDLDSLRQMRTELRRETTSRSGSMRVADVTGT